VEIDGERDKRLRALGDRGGGGARLDGKSKVPPSQRQEVTSPSSHRQQVTNLLITEKTGYEPLATSNLCLTRLGLAKLSRPKVNSPGCLGNPSIFGVNTILSHRTHLLTSLESQLPYKIVNLFFTIANSNIKLTLLCGR